MMKFRKLFNSKIISLAIANLFLFITTLYSCPITEDPHLLRVPIAPHARLEKMLREYTKVIAVLGVRHLDQRDAEVVLKFIKEEIKKTKETGKKIIVYSECAGPSFEIDMQIAYNAFRKDKVSFDQTSFKEYFKYGMEIIKERHKKLLKKIRGRKTSIFNEAWVYLYSGSEFDKYLNQFFLKNNVEVRWEEPTFESWFNHMQGWAYKQLAEFALKEGDKQKYLKYIRRFKYYSAQNVFERDSILLRELKKEDNDAYIIVIRGMEHQLQRFSNEDMLLYNVYQYWDYMFPLETPEAKKILKEYGNGEGLREEIIFENLVCEIASKWIQVKNPNLSAEFFSEFDLNLTA